MNTMKRALVAATAVASLTAGLTSAGSALAEDGQRLRPIRQIVEAFRSGEARSIDVQAHVQIGDGAPIVVEQNADVNIARVVQVGRNPSAAVSQTGVINDARVIQRAPGGRRWWRALR